MAVPPGDVAAGGDRNPVQPHPDGLKFAIFYTKVHDRILRPLMAGDQLQARHHYAGHSAPSTSKSASASTQPVSRPGLWA